MSDDSLQQLLLEWPITCEEPLVDNTRAIPAAHYQPIVPLYENAHAPKYHAMVAPTPIMEMKRWIELVINGMTKKSSILTEIDPITAQSPLEAPSQLSPSNMLTEIDPISKRQNVDAQQPTQLPIDQQLHDITQRQVNSEARSQSFWHEIDPTTGKAVDKEKEHHPLNGEMAGWKVL